MLHKIVNVQKQRRAIIIPPSEDMPLLNERLSDDPYEEGAGHGNAYDRYRADAGIEVEGFERVPPPGHVTAVTLARLGYLVFTVDYITVAYIPEVITDFQYDWCKENEIYIINNDFSIYSEENGEFVSYDKFKYPNTNLYKTFKRKLRKKRQIKSFFRFR